VVIYKEPRRIEQREVVRDEHLTKPTARPERPFWKSKAYYNTMLFVLSDDDVRTADKAALSLSLSLTLIFDFFV
jgi:hypothetical protein